MTKCIALALVLLTTACVVGEDGERDDEIGVIAGKKRAKVTVVQHNVEKTWGPIQNAIDRAKGTGAVGITLQEVCPEHVQKLRDTYGGQWSVIDEPQKKPASKGCNPLSDGTQATPHIVAIWTGGTSATKDGAYNALGAPADAPGNMLCISFPNAGVQTHLCSAHLISSKFVSNGVTYEGETVRKHQVKQVAEIVHPWAKPSSEQFAIIGGDFNGQPTSPPLDFMYASELGGQGDFTEYNRSGSSRNGQDTAHASGENTEDGQPYAKKIDYVFFSTNRAGLNNGDAQIDKDGSDHDMLTSSTMMDKR